VNSLSLGIGGAIGSLGGGALYDLGERLGMAALPWFVFTGLAVVTALSLARLVGDRRLEPRESNPIGGGGQTLPA